MLLNAADETEPVHERNIREHRSAQRCRDRVHLPRRDIDATGGHLVLLRRPRAARTGFTYLAATLMLLAGIWSFFEGLAAVVKKHFYVVTPNYAFKINVSTWGWIHLILGIVVLAAAICLFLGQTWARAVGIVLAILSGVANFLFIPYYPF